eukprot:GILK01001269.1.p1 GENE.GILK01001269.1~~GILK01001269.1.p1  ORF type:complete len:230 (+),score=34.35 GILK01001269.1:138-827(+)
MGGICSCSSGQEVVVRAPPPNTAKQRRPGGYVGSGIKATPVWTNDKPLTVEELKAKREEFWFTRVEGRPEAWQALRAACEADAETALLIVQAAGLTLVNDSLIASYDTLGNRYDIPVFCINEPTNLLTTRAQSVENTARTSSPAVVAPTPTKLRVRSCRTAKNVELELLMTDTIGMAKEKFAEAEGVPATRQRFFYMGKELLNDRSLYDCQIPEEYIVQVVERPASIDG